MPKPSLLLISATYVVDENRKKIEHLAGHFDLTCVTCGAIRSLGFDVTLRADEQPSGYRLISLPAVGRAESTTRYFLRGLGKVFASRPFDAVLVEAEPWAWIRWQGWLCKRRHQPRAIFGEFSWENIARTGLKGAVLSRFYRFAATTDDFVIAGNRAAKELFCRHGLPPAHVLVAPQLGVDETTFSPAGGEARAAARNREGIAPSAFLIGFCGRFVEEKGVLDLIRSVEAVRAAHPSRDIALVLLGSGPIETDLRSMARERSWLRLLAPRAHAEVAGFMALLDLFVLPSKPCNAGGTIWEEQFGHVLIEAMACGVACAGSDSGAIPEVLGDGALLFPAGDAAALAALLTRLIASEGIGALMRERVLRHFTNQAVAAQWAGFILARLAEKRAR